MVEQKTSRPFFTFRNRNSWNITVLMYSMTAVVDMKAYRLIGIRQKAAAQVQLKDGSYMKGNNNLTGTQELIILPSNVGTKIVFY